MPLTVTKETMQMHWKEAAGEQSSQILLEGDMIVPDSKPDLQKILRCEGKVKTRETRIGDERVSFSGELEIVLLYLPKNGEKPVYAMKSSLPMEDFIHMDGLEKDMQVSLKMELEYLDCQIINDRKIGVKAIIGVTAKAERRKTAEILSHAEGEDIECLKGTLQMEAETAELKDRFTVKEEWSLPSNKPEMGEILWESVSLTEQDVRPMDGKAMIRGNLKISILYTDMQGTIGSFTEKIPFSGYLEGDGIDARTIIDSTLSLEDIKLTPMPDEDGEMRQMAVDVSVGAMLHGREPVEREILLDAYAPNGIVELKRETVTYPVTIASGKNQFMLKERIQLENGEMPMLRVEDLWGEGKLSEMTLSADAIEAEGVLTVDVLYYCEDDAEPVCMLHRGIPFSQTMEMKGVRAEDAAEGKLRLEDLDFQILSEKEGELRATMTMETAVRRQETTEAVTDIFIQDCPAEMKPMAGAVIYMVQKGDSLWKIAKKYRTTIQDILAVNEIENPDLIYPGQKLLIIKMKR